jgi:hypothetical protein
LTYCILASAALISLHPLILGPGPIPATPQELDSWPATTDWSSFGRRRQPAYQALREAAFRLGKEAEVTTESSDINAATCYMLDFLSETGELRACSLRLLDWPLTPSYSQAHPRRPSLVPTRRRTWLTPGPWQRTDQKQRLDIPFGGRLSWRARQSDQRSSARPSSCKCRRLRSRRCRELITPLPSSPSDQRILYGEDSMSLDQLETLLSDKTTMRDQQPIFSALRPCRLASDVQTDR